MGGMILIIAAVLEVSRHKGRESFASYKPSGKTHVYLYGETHGEKTFYEKEFEIWKEHYDKDGMRDLFVEDAYYTAEFLNIWMHSEGDQILDQLYDDWERCPCQVPEIKEFYQNIKRECPDTIFYGTDVGHQRDTTGARYLQYLKENGKENSEEYRLTEKNIEQGKKFYEGGDDAEEYRENAMTENFCNTFDKLGHTQIMGIYGSDHCDPYDEENTGDIDNMAKRLRLRYGEIIECNSIEYLIQLDETVSRFANKK